MHYFSEMIKYDLEQNIYNFFVEVGGNSGREVNDGDSIKWVKTYPSCWPNYIFDARFTPELAEKELSILKESIYAGIAPDSWFIGPGSARSITPPLLRQYGFLKAFSWPGMILDLEKVIMPLKSPENFHIREIDGLEGLDRWSDIINSGMFGGGFDGTGLFSNLIGKEYVKLFLGYLGNIPVTTSLLYLNSGIASLFLIATAPGYRCRGFGTRITLEPIKKAYESGYLLAGLFATSAGERIYKKLGFKRCCDFDIYHL